DPGRESVPPPWARGPKGRDRLLDVEPRVSGVAQTPAGVLLQASPEEVPNGFGNRSGQRMPVRLALEDRDEDVRRRLAVEGAAAREHLVEHAPERPGVRAPIDLPAPG